MHVENKYDPITLISKTVLHGNRSVDGPVAFNTSEILQSIRRTENNSYQISADRNDCGAVV